MFVPSTRVLALAALASLGLAAAPAALNAAPASVTLAHHEGDGHESDIVATAQENGSFSTLLAAATAADLVETLKGEGPFTLLAPTDEAFAKLPASAVADLLKPENKDKLTAVLLYHVVDGKVPAKDVKGLTEFKTLQGTKVQVKLKDGKVMLNDATVTIADVMASNGVIHVIDTVLMPEG